MPIPSVYAVGAAAAGTAAAIAVPLPAGTVADDILILLIESANEPIAATTGYANVGVGTVAQATGLVTSLTVRWKRAVGGETLPNISSTPQNHIVGRIIGVRGCATTGSPVNGTPQVLSDNGTTTAFSIPGGTTTAADCLVVAALTTGTDTGNASATGVQASGWTSTTTFASPALTEQVDNWTNNGNGGGIAAAVGGRAASGAYNAITGTLTTGNTKACMSFALQGATVVALPPLAPVVSAIPAYRERQGFRQWPM